MDLCPFLKVLSYYFPLKANSLGQKVETGRQLCDPTMNPNIYIDKVAHCVITDFSLVKTEMNRSVQVNKLILLISLQEKWTNIQP